MHTCSDACPYWHTAVVYWAFSSYQGLDRNALTPKPPQDQHYLESHFVAMEAEVLNTQYQSALKNNTFIHKLNTDAMPLPPCSYQNRPAEFCLLSWGAKHGWWDREDMLGQECAGDGPIQNTLYIGAKKERERTQRDRLLFIRGWTFWDLTENIIFESKLYLSPK